MQYQLYVVGLTCNGLNCGVDGDLILVLVEFGNGVGNTEGKVAVVQGFGESKQHPALFDARHLLPEVGSIVSYGDFTCVILCGQ